MSIQAKGFKGRVGVDFETTYKTAPAVKMGKILPVNSFALGASTALIDPNTITGTRNPSEPGRGNTDVKGSAVYPVDLRAFGYHLRGILGDPVTTEITPGVKWQHVFTVKDDVPSMVFEKAFQDKAQYFIYSGVRTATMKIPFGGDGELTAQVDYAGAAEVSQGVPYDAAAQTVIMKRLSNFQAYVKDNGVKAGYVQSGDFTINANLDLAGYYVGDNGERSQLSTGSFGLTGTMKCMFADMTLINRSILGTSAELEIGWETSDGHSMKFDFPEVIYERTSPPLAGKAGVMLDINWRAKSANPATSAVTVTLINDVPSYTI